jgi:ABC-type branched-subunit amino acid transport system substrate-binding protein
MSTRERRYRHRAIAVVVLTATLAGCGSAAQTPQETAPDVDLATVRPPEVDAQAAMAFLGTTGTGPAGVVTQDDPFTIGLINQSHGAGSAPNTIQGATAAATALNEELGGMRGRAITLQVCETGSGESERDCAEQLRNAKVDLVITGYTPVDPEGMVAGLGDTPVTGVDPRSLAEEQNPFAAYYVLGRRGILETAATWVARNTNGPVLLVLDRSSGEPQLIEQATRALHTGGRQVERLVLDAADSDASTAAAETAMKGAGAIVVNTGADGCITVAEAFVRLRSQATVVTHGACSQRQVHDTLGDWSNNWIHVAGGPDLENYDQDPEAGYYRWRFETLYPDGDWTGWSSLAFSAVMNVAKAVNSARSTDPQEIVRSLQELSGNGYASQGAMSCGYRTRQPALCLHDARLYIYDGKRHWLPEPRDPRVRLHP